MFVDGKMTGLVLLSFTTQRVPCAAQTSQECVEDIEASFTHMFMEEVWVAFLEMVVQSSLTVEVDINTVRTHLLLLVTLCCAVHEARHVPDEAVVPFPFLIPCEQDVDCHGTLVFVVADIQWCVTGDLASSPSVPYTLRWMCLLSTSNFLKLADVGSTGIGSEQLTTTFWSLTPFLICEALVLFFILLRSSKPRYTA